MDAHDLKSGLQDFFGGTDKVYFHSLNRSVHYTEGVRFFAQNAGGGAYWLLDILATEPAILDNVEDDFYIVILKVVGNSAELTVTRDCSHDEEKGIVFFSGVVYQRAITFTDCPEGIWKFYFENKLIMLPRER